MTHKHSFIDTPYYFQNQNEYGEVWTTTHWGGYKLRNIDSDNSPRVNGKLKIRYNAANIYRSFFVRRPGDMEWILNPNLPHRKYAFGTVWYPWVSTFDDTAAKASLSSRLAARIRVAGSDLRVNLGEAFAQRRQTIDLVTNTATLLANSYRDIRRGRIPKAFSHIKEIDWSKKASNIWLQYHYGWVPLIQDIAGALTLAIDRPLTYEISATTREEDHRNFSFYQNTNEGRFLCEGFAHVEYKMRGNAKIRLLDYDRSRSFLDQTGLSNPALLAWELLPYSFVVDWFTNVGQYLESFNGFNGLEIIESCVTYTRKFSMYADTIKTNDDLSPGQTIKNQGFALGTDTVITRTLGLPSLTLPAIKTRLSLTKLVTSLALLRQVFSH